MKQKHERASLEATKMTADSVRIGEDIETLFGPQSSEAISYQALSTRYREEWKRLAEQRGLDCPAIAFVGPPGHGKSTLIALLTGRDSPSTERIHWIGPQVPLDPQPNWEESLLVQSADMADLGGAYTLVDTPGKAWRPEDEARFHILLAASRLKVLVLKEAKIEAEEWQRVAATCAGSFVLPVIRMSAADTIHYPANHDLLMERWQRENQRDITENLPGVNVELPIFIPELRAEGGRDKHTATALRQLTDALRSFLDKHRAHAFERESELSASWSRFLNALDPILHNFGGQLAAERCQELDRAIADLPRQIVYELLSNEKHLKAWFRLDARADLMNRISPLAFPFRPLASLLCFTTGSWDRLIIASTGSAPSAVLALMGGVSQKNEDRDAAKEHEKTPAFFKSVARRRLAEPWSDFLAAMKKAGANLGNSRDPFSAVQISGQDDLIDVWMQTKQSAATPKGRGPTVASSLASWLGTLLFWALMLGPLVHVYGQYIPAAFRSLLGQWTVANLAAYPIMPISFWLTAIVVSLVPCFLIALGLVAWWLRRRRTQSYLDELRSAMEAHLASHDAGLTVNDAHPQLTAYRRLTGLNRPGFSSL